MTPDEYKAAIGDINIKANRERHEVARKYATAHNKVAIGDVVEDHMGKVLVERIDFAFPHSGSLPCCVYYGKELKKDGTPRKNGATRSAWQTNLIKAS